MIEIIFGYEYDRNEILNFEHPKPQEKCQCCNTLVIGKFDFGFGVRNGRKQIMAKFNCPICHNNWMYDYFKQMHKRTLQRRGLIDQRGKLTTNVTRKRSY